MHIRDLWHARTGGILAALLVLIPGCAPRADEQATVDSSAAADFACDPDNGGITLADGFCATVFADAVGAVRHLAVTASGDVYAAAQPGFERAAGRRQMTTPGGVQAFRDTTGDGKADVIERVNEVAGTGLALHDGYLYYSSDTEVFRVGVRPGELLPTGEPESIVAGFEQQGQHASKPMTFDDAGNMYVTVGGPSNACQESSRTPGSPGLDPCPQLQLHGGIWRFSDSVAGQMQSDGIRYATGIRNAVAIDWNLDAGALYAMQHGRDSLHDLWGDLFSLEQSAEMPAEELLRIREGDDFGWPYCYYDRVQGAKLLNPEYGGDGTAIGRCADVVAPVASFPAHWAPNDLIFYRNGSFPDRYEGGAFIAFHGSWNRMPFPQQGYNVVFVPFVDGAPAAEYEVFADGFAGMEEINLQRAEHRPTGLAQGPDGSLYIASDFKTGRIWRVRAERPAR